jgi:ATP-dependent exoDNAse (exonuclease V) alpha subunit
MATHTLVIDEISMAKPDLLNKLDYVFKILRFDRSAFGGLQIIFCGDFLQLPPVWKHDPDKEFAFNARSWKESNLKVVYLTEIVRQHNDPIFANLLNELRVGDVSNIDILKSKIDFKFPEDGIDPVYVCCKNVDVDKLNSEMLKDVVGVSKTFKTKDVGSQYHIDFFNKNCPVPEKLELKIGAQVMLLKNIDANNGLVNGSIGKILKYLPDGVLVKFKHCEAIIPEQTWELKEQVKGFGNKTTLKVVASRTQIPLRIAYAITVHKSQGATLDRAIIDVSEAFADGQIYVALSRVRDLDSLSVTHFSPARIKVNKECLDYYQNLK